MNRSNRSHKNLCASLLLKNLFITVLLYLTILCAVGPSLLYSQEFIHLATGTNPSLTADGHGGVYATWENGDKPIPFFHFDSNGTLNQNDSATFQYGFSPHRPRLAIGSPYSVIVWDEHLSPVIDYLKTYIIGAVFKTSDPDQQTLYMVNDNPLDNLYRHNPQVQFITDTLLIAVWDESLGGRSYIKGQMFSVSGTWIGPNFLLSDHDVTKTSAGQPRIVARQGSETFVVIWEDNSSGKYHLYGRKYDLHGSPQGASFLISDDPQMTYMYYYAVATDTAGNFCVIWNADKGTRSQMEWRWFKMDGTPLSAVETLTPLDTLVSAGTCVELSIDEKNRAVVVWEENKSLATGETRIYGRCYSAVTHAPIGDAFKISNDTVGRYDNYPNVVATGGRIFVAWKNDTSGIRGKVIKIETVTSVYTSNTEVPQQISCQLYPNYPNPFNPSTTIRFILNVSLNIKLSIFDLLGKEKSVIFDKHLGPGYYSTQWNGKDADGKLLPSGIYFVRLSAGNTFRTQKMLLMK